MNGIKMRKNLKRLLVGAVLSACILQHQSVPAVAAIDVGGATQVSTSVAVDGGDKRVMMNVRSIALRDLLKMLSAQAGFNILLDESVQGEISVDLNNISVNQALDSIKDYANLVFLKDDNTLIVASEDSELSKTMNLDISQIIPVKYVNAGLVAKVLNSTIFAQASGDAAAQTTKKASYEFRTNSVVIVGNNHEVKLAMDLIAKIDVPRKSKTFKINHANAYNVAQLLQATIYNDGVSPYDASSSDGLQASAISVLTETFEEGQGAASEVMGAASGGVGGTQQTFTLRRSNITEEEVKISPEGAIVIPDSRSNTVTILGTSEQIALAEAVIPTLDQKLPQVAIETSLIEVFEEGLREFQAVWGQHESQLATGFNNQGTGGSIQPRLPGIQPQSDATLNFLQDGALQTVTAQNFFGLPYNIIGLPTLNGQGDIGGNGSALAFSTSPIHRGREFIYQINAIISKEKGKLLANPTVVAVHNTESLISITDEIVRRTTVTRDSTGFEQIQVEIGEAGIILNILPKITGDGYVNLRIRPSISTIKGVTRDENGNIITLLQRRDFAVQETRVADGQTLALGGLLQETARKDVSKVPGLADLPIIGALFRTTSRQEGRSELIMLVTPKILDSEVPKISSSFSIPSLKDDIKNNPQNIEIPADKISQEPTEAEKKELEKISSVEMPLLKPEVRSDFAETTINAYQLDSIIRQLGIPKEKIDMNKTYNKEEVDRLLNEYTSNGSK